MKKKNPPHRPIIPIDWNQVDKWLEAHCSGAEIASIIGIYPDTLYDRCQKEKGMVFTEYAQQKKSKGDASIKSKQYEEAMKGDRGMLIWLGKQWLGQRDNQDLNVSGDMKIGIVNYGSNPDPKPWQSPEEEEE